MKTGTILLVAFLAAFPIAADEHLPVAPQYYLDVVIGMSLAEQYAWHCPEIEVNGDAIGATYAAMLEQLAAAGIKTDPPHENMLLPPPAETDAKIHDMLARHQGAEDPKQSFCDGASMEMAEETIVGSFLTKTK